MLNSNLNLSHPPPTKIEFPPKIFQCFHVLCANRRLFSLYLDLDPPKSPGMYSLVANQSLNQSLSHSINLEDPCRCAQNGLIRTNQQTRCSEPISIYWDCINIRFLTLVQQTHLGILFGFASVQN